VVQKIGAAELVPGECHKELRKYIEEIAKDPGNFSDEITLLSGPSLFTDPFAGSRIYHRVRLTSLELKLVRCLAAKDQKHRDIQRQSQPQPQMMMFMA
jgi:radical SAM superfamily enzyme YgiQ (UPF0313 family)